MALGQNQKPLEAINGEKVSVDETPDRNALATADRSVALILEEILREVRKLRLAAEIKLGEEIDDDVASGDR